MNRIERIVTLERLASAIEAAREEGRTVALANGLFDLLHVGHLRYLEAAAQHADLLVVAVNSDRSARALRGPSRPVVPEAERAELIAGLGCVDLVTIFDEPSVETLLRRLRPDVHCKGTDYTTDNVPEAAAAKALGVRIAICGDPKDHNSTDIIGRVRSLPD